MTEKPKEICAYDPSFVTGEWYRLRDEGEYISKIHSRKIKRRRLYWFRIGKDEPKTKMRKR